MRLACLVVVLAVAGCGGGTEPPGPEPLLPPVVQFETTAAWAARPDAEAEVRAALAWSVAFWGGKEEQLDGWTVELVDGAPENCGTAPGVWCWGCAQRTGRGGEIVVMADFPTTSCVWLTALPHEVGHAILGGDSGHTDPRWGALSDAQLAAARADPACQ